MEYTYYVPVIREEHCLFASELAEMFGIYTANGRPHTKLVTALLSKFEKEDGKPPLYYETKHGLRRVFCDGIKWTEQLWKYGNDQPGTLKTISLDDKTYKFRLERI